MDDASKNVVMMLEALANVNRRIGEMALRVRLCQGVSGVSHGLTCKKYDTGSMVEGYVEVDILKNRAMCFWLDLEWRDEFWKVNARVFLTHSSGQDSICEFPEQQLGSLLDCLHVVSSTAAELFSHVSFFEKMLMEAASDKYS